MSATQPRPPSSRQRRARPPSAAQRLAAARPRSPVLRQASPGSPPPAAKGDHVTYLSVLKSDIYKVQMRGEKLLRELERELLSGGAPDREEELAAPSKRRSEIDTIKRSTADVEALLAECRSPTEERLALLEHLSRKMADVESMVLHTTDGVVPAATAATEGVLQYGQPAASRLPTFMGLVDRALALHGAARGVAPRGRAAAAAQACAAERADAGEVASLAGQAVYQVSQLCGEAGVPFEVPRGGPAASLAWCVEQLAEARGDRGVGGLRAREAEARAAAARAAQEALEARRELEGAREGASQADALRAQLQQASEAAASLQARAAAERGEAAAALEGRTAALAAEADAARRAAAEAEERAARAEAALAEAEAAREADGEALADEVDRLNAEFDGREAEAARALAARDADLTAAQARAASLELQLQGVEADLEAARHDEALASRACLPDQLGAVAARLKQLLEGSAAAPPQVPEATEVARLREAATALMRRLGDAELASAQLADLRAAELLRARDEIRDARAKAGDAEELARGLEAAHAERLHEAQERAREAAGGAGDFEEALRDEMRSMKAAFELKLCRLQTQLARQAAEHGRQARRLQQEVQSQRRASSVAALARPSTARIGGGRGRF